MGPQKLCLHLLFFLSFFCFFHCSYYCYACSSWDHNSNCLDDEASSPYDITSDSSYFESVGSGDGTGGEVLDAHYSEQPSGFVSADKLVNVKSYGARGDGTDATQAFTKAWSAACSSNTAVIFLVPASNTFLLKPITFSGPCKSSVTVRIQGTIIASPNRSDWSEKNRRQWIEFNAINNLYVQGGGTINGNGEIWWKNSCKINKSLPCKGAPTAMTFYSCNNLRVENLNVKNSQQIHVSFQKCNNVKASTLTITAPGESPNTDGIHVTATQNIQITNCVIRTGDDCISIVSGSQRVTATNIACGPGHGISIGSLGAKNAQEYVSDVMVDTANLDGSTNGVRIKTYQGGRGYARNITFQNINMHNVENPIIIDQNYCDSKTPCKQQSAAVEVSNVLYKNIKGTSATQVAIKFDCSKSVPCRGLVLQDINLVASGGASAKSICSNVNLTKKGKVVPAACAQKLLEIIREYLMISYY